MSAALPRVVLAVLLPTLALLTACTSPSETAVPAVTLLTTTATVNATSTVTESVVGPTVTLPATTSLATTTQAATVTATRTATKTVTVSRAATTAAPPTSSSSAAAGPGGANPWSSDSEQVAGAPAPAFPASLPGWRRTASWDTTTRAFSGQWAPVDGPDGSRFPSTMNGCDDHRFLLRWRSTGTGAQIDAGIADAADSTNDVTTDTAGWMAFDGCEHPVVRFHGNTDELTDLAVSVQEYEPAA